jgi:hypothetical protein
MITEDLRVEPSAFEARTGWASKPEGLCKGDLCVPASDAIGADGRLDLTIVADKLGMPVVADKTTGTYAIGPEAMGHSLTTATAPELELPAVTGTTSDGNTFKLSSLHGRKVLLVAWASW